MSDMDASAKKQSTSGMAIAGLVLGIVALVSSWVPIVNNFSFFIAAIGALLALIGLLGVLRGKKVGKGLAIAAVAVNVVAVAVVLVTQSAYSAALDDATKGAEVVSTTEQATEAQGQDAAADASSDAASSDAANPAEMPVGGAAQLDNGLTVSVDSVTPGLVNYDGSTVTGVQVTITNGGSEVQDFNVFDWKCEDANGVQTSFSYYSESQDDLNSGSLAAGGTVTGSIYFDGDITKVMYFGNVFSDTPTATWTVA